MGVAPQIDPEIIKAAASVLGTRPRLTRERKRQLKLESIDRERIYIWRTLWHSIGHVRGDPREYIEREWSRKIPKMYERLWAAAASGERIPDAALDILKAMTIITRTLAPAANKQMAVDPAILGLPSDADLSHLSDDELARVLRRPPPGSEQLALPKPRGGKRNDRSETVSANHHAPQKSKGKARGKEKKVEASDEKDHN